MSGKNATVVYYWAMKEWLRRLTPAALIVVADMDMGVGVTVAQFLEEWNKQHEHESPYMMHARDGEAVEVAAWIFDLAVSRDQSTGEYNNWRKCVQISRPHVPEGAEANVLENLLAAAESK
jgi:hypothetical protein